MSIVGNANLLLFAALPIVWGSIAFTTSVVDMVYGWIVDIYDKDFLAADMLYGEDYGKNCDFAGVQKKQPPDNCRRRFWQIRGKDG